jgi:hypothetical protein
MRAKNTITVVPAKGTRVLMENGFPFPDHPTSFQRTTHIGRLIAEGSLLEHKKETQKPQNKD